MIVSIDVETQEQRENKKEGESRVERGQNAMNVIESDLLYTARSGSEFTDPVSGSGLV